MPDLPDTDDPHALLGVATEATADEVRRAYLRRIKVFKPDRHPDAFRRIRGAFEALQAGFEIRARLRDVTPPAAGWDHDAEPEPEPARAAPTSTRRQRLEALTTGVYDALREQRRDEAGRLLLTPEAELLAVEPAFTGLLLDVCCATIWSATPLHAALTARYPDIITAADCSTSEYWSHPLWDLQSLSTEKSGWLHQTASIPELTGFLEEGAVQGGAFAEQAGAAVAERLGRDPMAVLEVLDRAVTSAPSVVELLSERADAWADAHGGEPVQSTEASPPTAVSLVRQLEASLDDPRRLLVEWLKRLAVTLAMPALVVAVGAPLTPLLFSLLIGAIAYHTVFDATRAMYAQIIRPTLVPWLVATGQPLTIVTEQLRRQLASRGRLSRLLRPDGLSRYPALLADDSALRAVASLARVAQPGRASG